MMIHPATVHFAIVLPVVASVFGIVYLINREELFSKISTILILFTALAMAGVWYSGSIAGPEIYDFLSEAGQNTLVQHKELGLYLAISMGLVALLKIIGCKVKKFFLEAIAIIALIVITLATFVQGNMGGELVYNHGTPFKSFMIMDTLHETAEAVNEEEEDSAKVELYQEALEDIELIHEEVEIYYGNQAEQE
ncbi:MAG: hypothetical protein SPLUMA2_SPLUMAMAG2_01869 [uncultured Sulfurimonas sp.]|jgi:uncharacterized membrane protein|nr:MAG: hypothetical protein SPLUMA1_SPLUMAMAG1_01524 [uncultured Sulfurimonas sp.]CAI6152259.1 MAG: hypothetical protein SPLUMA2_SPLUMAMAG2_01869 [uncultured Sulfurimonas sp.]